MGTECVKRHYDPSMSRRTWKSVSSSSGDRLENGGEKKGKPLSALLEAETDPRVSNERGSLRRLMTEEEETCNLSLAKHGDDAVGPRERRRWGTKAARYLKILNRLVRARNASEDRAVIKLLK
ncbi:hypothetical protein AMTRI_Chr03g46480 [Amborella trichopoda]